MMGETMEMFGYSSGSWTKWKGRRARRWSSSREGRREGRTEDVVEVLVLVSFDGEGWLVPGYCSQAIRLLIYEDVRSSVWFDLERERRTRETLAWWSRCRRCIELTWREKAAEV
jgi:hypothetical protein